MVGSVDTSSVKESQEWVMRSYVDGRKCGIEYGTQGWYQNLSCQHSWSTLPTVHGHLAEVSQRFLLCASKLLCKSAAQTNEASPSKHRVSRDDDGNTLVVCRHGQRACQRSTGSDQPRRTAVQLVSTLMRLTQTNCFACVHLPEPESQPPCCAQLSINVGLCFSWPEQYIHTLCDLIFVIFLLTRPYNNTCTRYIYGSGQSYLCFVQADKEQGQASYMNRVEEMEIQISYANTHTHTYTHTHTHTHAYACAHACRPSWAES
jgi:hypothetical protein